MLATTTDERMMANGLQTGQQSWLSVCVCLHPAVVLVGLLWYWWVSAEPDTLTLFLLLCHGFRCCACAREVFPDTLSKLRVP